VNYSEKWHQDQKLVAKGQDSRLALIFPFKLFCFAQYRLVWGWFLWKGQEFCCCYIKEALP